MMPDGEVKRKRKRPCLSKRKAAKRLKLLLDDPHCHYCGRKLNKNEATIDHKLPRSKGGKNSLDNLVLACRKCNTLKSDMDYEDFRQHIIIVASKTRNGNTKPKLTIIDKKRDEELTTELNRLLSLLS